MAGTAREPDRQHPVTHRDHAIADGNASGIADLERLAIEIRDNPAARGWDAEIVRRRGARPYLRVRNPAATEMHEHIYAGDGGYWWGWAEPIGPVSDAEAAGRKIIGVLRASRDDEHL